MTAGGMTAAGGAVAGGAVAAEQAVLDGMPRRLLPCTPSSLTTWLDCPRRYRMAYVDRPTPPKGPAWAHNSFGTTVHNALRAWVTAPRDRRTPEHARTLVDLSWVSDGYRDEAQQEQWREKARDAVAAYAGTLDPDDEPVGVERTVATPYAGMALRGRIDRIDERDGELVVVDYKTGRHVPDEGDVRGSLALAVYAHATARTLRKPCFAVELHHVPTGRVVAWRHTEESLARHLGRAADTAEEVRAATEFPARPGPGCAWCDFVRVCDEGRAAAAPRRSWDAMDETAT